MRLHMKYKQIKYSVFKTMDMEVLTTQTMAAADKDVEWVKVHTELSIHFHFKVDDWLILRYIFLILILNDRKQICELLLAPVRA